jgi:hypothetical protein
LRAYIDGKNRWCVKVTATLPDASHTVVFGKVARRGKSFSVDTFGCGCCDVVPQTQTTQEQDFVLGRLRRGSYSFAVTSMDNVVQECTFTVAG